MRPRLVRKWLPLLLFVVGWTVGWAFAWQGYLFDRFELESAPGVEVLSNEQLDGRSLWLGVGVSLALGGLGFLFLVFSDMFKATASRLWSRSWLILGAGLTVIGLAGPILFPSTTNLVVNNEAQTVAIDQRWLYAATSREMRFHDIERLSLRVRRTRVAAAGQAACQVTSGLSIVLRDGTWVSVANGFDHEAIARSVAEAANAQLEDLSIREC